MSISKEDYLGEIYRVQQKNNRAAKLTEIAASLKVSKPSTSQMVRKLSKEGLVEFERYSGITLTKKGIEEARTLIRKHQLLEVFFNKFLNIKHRFHHEAHNMEHGLSNEAADRLDALLKNPALCPDGNPIPRENIMELRELSIGGEADILFCTTQDKKCMEQLNSLGLVPRTRVKVIRKIKNGPLMLKVKDSEIALGNDVCSKVYVERI